MKKAILFSLACVVFGSCTTQVPQFTEPGTAIPLNSLQVKADREPYGLRVDVFRMDPFGNPAVNSQKNVSLLIPILDPSIYAPIGIDLGNGLFYDFHGNLAVDLVRLYQLSPPFQIKETVGGLVAEITEFVAEDKAFHRTRGGNSDLSVTFKSGQWEFFNSAGDSWAKVFLDTDGLVFQSTSLQLSGNRLLKQVDTGRVESKEALTGGNSFVLTDNNEVDLGHKLHLRLSENRIAVNEEGYWFDNGPTWNYGRTKTGCWFTDSQGNTFEVRLVDRTILILKNGVQITTYCILSGG